MFTVKATYRGHTRKFTFPESNSFPSFDQLYKQLYRVFPVSQNYYLSKLLFSPDSSKNSRILIGREVHSEKEYIQCLLPFQGSSWANALLRFSVFDENSCQSASILSADVSQAWSTTSVSATEVPPSIISNLSGGPGIPDIATQVSDHGPAQLPTPPRPPISLFHIPPPPIIYSSSPPQAFTQVPTEVNWSSMGGTYPDHIGPPSPVAQSKEPQSTRGTPKPCACVSGKQEIQALISTFKDDLTHILIATFGPQFAQSAVTLPDVPQVPPMPPTSLPSFSSLFKACHSCFRVSQGPWYVCEKCMVVQCSTCKDSSVKRPCFANNGGDHCLMEMCAPCPSEAGPSTTMPANPFNYLPPLPPIGIGLPVLPNPPTHLPPRSFIPDHGANIWGSTDFQSTYTPVVPFVPPSNPPSLAGNSVQPLPEVQTPPVDLTPQRDTTSPETVGPTPVVINPPPPPVIHRGVVCDVCQEIVEGIRHKCLDCPNYDLCTACITSGSAERHNPFHEFFEIKEPGRVLVHTVFSGNGDGGSSNGRVTNAQPLDSFVSEPQVAVHFATCDLCDSRIRGDRYKCVDCPDFDTCSPCFSITSEQHPNHTFVKIRDVNDYVPVNNVLVKHFATCNACGRGINGVRYKCMHPDCPDFDLCERCEAMPIPIHPPNHPMLKMKSADTVIPTVYRVGQTVLIPQAGDSSHSSSKAATPHPPRRHTEEQGRSSINPTPNPVAGDRLSWLDNLLQGNPHPFVLPLHTPSPLSPPNDLYHSPTPSPRSIPGGFRTPSPGLPPQELVSPVSRRFTVPERTPSPLYHPLPTTDVAERSQSPLSFLYGTQAQPSITSEPYGNPPRSPISYLSTPYSPPMYPASLYSPAPPMVSPVISPVDAPSKTTDLLHYSPPISPVEHASLSVGIPEVSLLSTDPGPVKRITDKSKESKVSPPSEDAHAETASDSSSSVSRFKLPPLVLDQSSDLFHEVWPRVIDEFQHLMVGDTREALVAKGNKDVLNLAIESPVTGEALLHRPTFSGTEDRDSAQSAPAPVSALSRSLAVLLNGGPKFTTPQPVSREVPEPQIVVNLPKPGATTGDVSPVAGVPVCDSSTTISELPIANSYQKTAPLSAVFLADVTVPDGQVFPPGAEFVKCWKMLNDSEREWPDSTELVFVAGESLAREPTSKVVKVGSLAAGSEIDLWTGELKAPETPGRYVSYWRLRDGEGNVFGNSIWIDISVQEMDPHSEQSSNSSLASSSIIMPRSAPSQSTAPSVQITKDNLSAIDSSASMPPSVAPSLPATNYDGDGTTSDDGSEASSLSLVSIPSSNDDDDDDAIWQDSRSHFSNERGGDFVILYDDNSSGDD